MMTKDEYMDKYASQLSDRIKRYRLTQAALAERSKVSIPAISRYMKGERLPNIYIAYKIEVAMHELIKEKQEVRRG